MHLAVSIDYAIDKKCFFRRYNHENRRTTDNAWNYFQNRITGSGYFTENKRAAGYDGIELNGFMIRPSSMMVRMLTKFAGMPTGNGGKFNWLEMTQEAGLDIISIHEDLNGIKNNPDAIIAECEKYNTKNIVITGMYRFDYTDPEAIKGLCNDLNTCGAKLAESGITLMYHNHNVDFLKVAGTDKSAYETILDGN